MQHVVDSIAVDVRAPTTSPGFDAVGYELEYLSETISRQRRVRSCTPHKFADLVLAHAFIASGGTLRDDLLSQDVKGRNWRMNEIQRTVPYRSKQRGALNEFVSRHGIDATLR